MKYKFLPLTIEQFKNPGLYGGLSQIRNNPEDLVEFSSLKDLGFGTEKSLTYIIYNNTAYTIYKHYIDLDNNEEIIVGKPVNFGGDRIRTS